MNMKFHPKRTRIKRVRPISNARRSFLFTKPAPQETIETPQVIEKPIEVLAVEQPEPEIAETVAPEEPIQEEVTAVADDTTQNKEPMEGTIAKPKKGRGRKNKTTDEPTEQTEAVDENKESNE